MGKEWVEKITNKKTNEDIKKLEFLDNN